MRDPSFLVTFAAPRDVVRAVDRLALLRGVTRSAIVRAALAEMLTAEAERRRADAQRDEAAEAALERRRKTWRESKQRTRRRAA